MSVDARLSALEARLAAVEARLAGAAPSTATTAGSRQSSGGGQVADDRELDSEYGNPVVKKDPKRWTGDSFAGCRMSECPPEYLMVLADLFDWMADKDDESGKTWTSPTKAGAKPIPASTFGRKDAARARGWAARNRDARRTAKPTSTTQTTGGGAADSYEDAADDIPFAFCGDVTWRAPKWERW